MKIVINLVFEYDNSKARIIGLEKRLKSFVAEFLAERFVSYSDYCDDYTLLESVLNGNSVSDLLKIYEMYGNALQKIPATNNIISNRRNAIHNILKLTNTNRETNNILVKHYFNKNEIPPVWISIHTLSLGDIIALYNLIDKKYKIEFCNQILNKDRIRNKEVVRISAKLELIRKMRNIINHYEPLIPFFIDCEKDELIFTLSLLKHNYENSYCKTINLNNDLINEIIEKNDYNKKYLKLIEEIIELLA